MIGVTCKVVVKAEGEVPRSQGKAVRVVDRVEGALGERREGANRLDLVAEEVDPQRLAAGRRKHVDDAAAHGELAALVSAIDPGVAREREVLRERVEA